MNENTLAAQIVALIVNGGGLAWLAWEIRQLRTEVAEDFRSVRRRLEHVEEQQRKEPRCPVPSSGIPATYSA